MGKFLVAVGVMLLVIIDLIFIGNLIKGIHLLRILSFNIDINLPVAVLTGIIVIFILITWPLRSRSHKK